MKEKHSIRVLLAIALTGILSTNVQAGSVIKSINNSYTYGLVPKSITTLVEQ